MFLNTFLHTNLVTLQQRSVIPLAGYLTVYGLMLLTTCLRAGLNAPAKEGLLGFAPLHSPNCELLELLRRAGVTRIYLPWTRAS